MEGNAKVSQSFDLSFLENYTTLSLKDWLDLIFGGRNHPNYYRGRIMIVQAVKSGKLQAILRRNLNLKEIQPELIHLRGGVYRNKDDEDYQVEFKKSLLNEDDWKIKGGDLKKFSETEEGKKFFELVFLSPEMRVGVSVADENIFRREGGVWAVRFKGGKTFRYGDLKGFKYLHILLSNPWREFSVLELVNLVEKPQPNSNNSVLSAMGGKEFQKEGLAIESGSGSLGGTLDDRGRKELKDHLNTLKSEREEAKRKEDLYSLKKIDQETEFITKELERGKTLQGKPRYENPELKKARQSITKAVDTARKKIKDSDKGFFEHLKHTIRPGNSFSYNPAQPSPGWVLH